MPMYLIRISTICVLYFHSTLLLYYTFSFPIHTLQTSNVYTIRKEMTDHSSLFFFSTIILFIIVLFIFMAGNAVIVIIMWCVMAGTAAFIAIYVCFEKKAAWRTRTKRPRALNAHSEASIETPGPIFHQSRTFHHIRNVGSFSSLDSPLYSQSDVEPDYLRRQQYYRRITSPPPVYSRHSLAPLYLTLPSCPPLYLAQSEESSANRGSSSNPSTFSRS